MVDPIIARRLGDLIEILKCHLGKTSIVVTHDMRLPSGSPTWCSSCIRAGLNISARWRDSWHRPTRIFSNSWRWMPTHYLRNKLLLTP